MILFQLTKIEKNYSYLVELIKLNLAIPHLLLQA